MEVPANTENDLQVFSMSDDDAGSPSSNARFSPCSGILCTLLAVSVKPSTPVTRIKANAPKALRLRVRRILDYLCLRYLR